MLIASTILPDFPMEAKHIQQYRSVTLNHLEKLLPDSLSPIDSYIDDSIRILSGLPKAPLNSIAYEGIYGKGKPLEQYRYVAFNRLEELLSKIPRFDLIDESLDGYIRSLSNLPERPIGIDPYVRLFILREHYSGEGECFASCETPPSQELVTTEQLIRIAGTNKFADRLKLFTPGVNLTLEKYKINTELRIAHFLAQVMHESGGFRWLREIWGPTAIQKRYEGRRDLGNTQPGDGKRFMGRGLIQLTGRFNYQQFTNAIGKDFNVKGDFVANPELVETAPFAIIVAGWYWDSRNINSLADADNLIAVTRRVNGGTIGLEDRRRYLARAKVVL